MTLDRYGHLFPAQDRDLADALMPAPRADSLPHRHPPLRRPQRDDDPRHAPPPAGYTLDMLDTAIRATVARISVTNPDELLSDRSRGADRDE